MQDLAYKVYLLGQLPKLAHHGEYERYRANKAICEVFGIQPSSKPMEEFNDPGHVQEFVEKSADRSAMAEIFSSHHKNGVMARIREHETWEEHEFSFEQVKVGNIEENLMEIVLKNDRDLIAVAREIDRIQPDHYKETDHPIEKEVGPSKYLGRWDGDKVQLFDGNHRAIHQARRFLRCLSPNKAINIVVPKR